MKCSSCSYALLLCLLMSVLSPVLAEEPVSETLVLEGRKYHLETYLWRDFMPISPPDGKPMSAVVKLVTGGRSEPLEVTWKELRVWQDGKKVWDTALKSDLDQGFASGGPKLSPGSLVKLEADFVGPDGKARTLRASEQLIHETF